ncbi:DUF1826 domain-containing protein [Halomonas sp. PAMB 3264]|uniref:DUF1826 domain-containing protein n=1 Tax=Halomonas sp. PAMB 3264 TaxID=3075222 RepID=UPI002898E8CD|nr:DUF1826 domain-containing protein [Halomonas sp. PAMB 3264]WNL42730.1 DUF1826 domain-containing protein [Halomonas sp. PAMB 3264]
MTLQQQATDSRLPDHAAADADISVLPRIFDEAINIAVFERALPADIALSAKAQCQTERAWQFGWLGEINEAFTEDLRRHLPAPEAGEALIEDIATVASAVAFLFETDTVGVRLRLLNSAMCPRFHCDNLAVRLVTTYVGPGSEWLPEHAVNRLGLGAPRADRPEVAADPHAVQCLECGDIALIKGSGWIGCEERGLVHRSPALAGGEKRLLLTIDPA